MGNVNRPPVRERDRIAAMLREVILTTWPGRFHAAELSDAVPLGSEGLGLDSVEIVEVLLASEDEVGIEAGPSLVKLSPLTIAQVADHLAHLVD